MALSASTMKATIKAQLTAITGTPEDPVKQDEFATALANALFTILTVQAQVAMTGGGVDTNGDTLVVNLGAIT